MLKRGWILGLVCCLLLTGCGSEDKLLQYIGDNDVGMVNTKDEAEALYAGLDRESGMKWIYDRERIESLIQLKQNLNKEVQTRGYTLREETDVGNNALMTWKTHMDQGKNPEKETARYLSFLVSGKGHDKLREICEKIEAWGYPEVSKCLEGKEVLSRGISFEVMDDLDENGITIYDLYITVPNSIVYYPEKCKGILETMVENGYYVEWNICMGGPLNMITCYHDTKSILCKYIKLYLDNTGRVVEINIGMEDKGIATVRSEEEKKLLVELVTNLTGDRNESIAFVEQFSREGKKKGTIGGEYSWSISRSLEYYILRIQ